MRKVIKSALKDLEKNGIDYSSLRININTDLDVGGWVDANDERFINNYFVNIEIEEFEDIDNSDNSKIINIGNAICCYISEHSYAMDNYIDMADIADAKDGDICLAVSAATDNEGQLLDDYFGSGILYIDTFYINPQYRGKGIGKIIFPLVLDALGREAGAIVIIPCPTEEDGEERMDIDDTRYKPMLKRMTNFIKEFGFYEVDRKNRVWIKDTKMK